MTPEPDLPALTAVRTAGPAARPAPAAEGAGPAVDGGPVVSAGMKHTVETGDER